MKDIKLHFPLNQGGEIDGIADGGMEGFKNYPLTSLAREICQNSLDAMKDKSKPVVVEFSTFSINKEDIPDILGLQKDIELLKIYWRDDPKAFKTFSNMREKLQGLEIVCLRISDFNTTGLRGSKQGGFSSWQSLVKTKGFSLKSASEGGSFGIGKFAPFAASSLRCVFYATKDDEGCEAFQGVARLASFKNEQGELTRSVGYFGKAINNEHLHSWYSLDLNFNRNESGTDIFILGFEQSKEWGKEIITSVLDSFLYAIYKQKLVVKVESEQIDKESLPKLIKQYKARLASDYYNVLVDKNSKEFMLDYDKYGIKGSFCLKLLNLENSKKQVAMIREIGMKIKDRRIGDADFSGVLLIKGDSLNEYLKSLEDPSHSNWSVHRTENKKVADEVLSSMISFIISSYNELISGSSNEQIDAPAGEFVPLYRSGTKNKEENIFDYIEKLSEEEYIKSQKPSSAIEQSSNKEYTSAKDHSSDILDQSEYQSSDKNEVPSEKQSQSEPRNQNNNQKPLENEGSKKEQNLTISKKHLICKNQAKGEYRVIFEPQASVKNAKIAVFLSTEDGDGFKAKLKNAFDRDCNKCEISGNEIINLDFEQNISVCFDFCVDYDEICALEVRAYEGR